MKILKDFYIDENGMRRCFRELLSVDRKFELVHYRDRAGNIFTEDLSGRFGLRNRVGELVRKEDVRKFVAKHKLGDVIEQGKKIKILLNPKKSKAIKLEEQAYSHLHPSL